ncbi:MAG: DUF6387 family protein [Gammaproteobacteria bacterium]
MKKANTQAQCINQANHKTDLLARKTIRSAKDLPAWFDIKKYNAVSNMDAKGWHEQLHPRAECLQTDNNDTGIAETFLKSVCKYYLETIAINPLIDYSQSMADIVKSVCNVEIANFKDIWQGIYAPTAVHHISILHAYTALREILTADLYQLLAQWWDEMGPHSDNFFTQTAAAPEWLDTPITWRDYALFKINLNAPDDLILAQCKVALSKAREGQQVAPPKHCFTAKDFNKWHDFSVLPYCDLTIWANYENITIPLRIMADAIFIDGEKGEASIRRVTAPLVALLMDNEAIYQLHTQSLS